MLSVRIARRKGGFELDAGLEVPAGSVAVIVGESGSGKTTLLRAVAGLERPDRGRITLTGEPWFDAGAGIDLPPQARSVGYVAQDYALFPHLTVAQNVAFGLRASHVSGRDAARRALAALERLGVAELAGRRPRELSGGQQQRAALARALVLEPRVLLLDEPLSALDARTRRGVRGALRRLLAELPCVTLYVTHSPAEALAFGASVVVLEAGRVSQSGSRAELMRHPRTPYVAEFLGVNLFRGVLRPAGTASGAHVATPRGDLEIDATGEGGVAAVVHPREVTLSRARPSGSARNVIEGAIDELAPEPPRGERVRVSLAGEPPLIAEVTREAAEALQLAPGMRVFASFKATGVVLGDADEA